ncbi:MAG: putative toxin-antitoxin system toxin component, PIN family, partial [Tannerella sp.]|nr:putative toxin-antitoxin system toxin component, PIN family [Tannerella sp.]
MKVVFDTNCLLVSISRKSPFYDLWRAFIAGKFTLCYTSEILQEYEELLLRYYSQLTADIVMSMLLDAPNTNKITSHFNWNLIVADPDDNKFVDCALNAGAEYIVTNDKHFNV